MSLIDLATPLSQEEYRRVIGQQVLSHEPLPPVTVAYYHGKGRVLSAFIRPGMTAEEVRGVLGVRPSGWVKEDDQDGERWTHYTVAGGEPIGSNDKWNWRLRIAFWECRHRVGTEHLRDRRSFRGVLA